MPVNKSRSKVRVVKVFGSGATLGLMDPHVGMVVSRGPAEGSGMILAIDSGNYHVVLGLGYNAFLASAAASGKFYPEQLTVNSGVAGNYGWPTGSDCVKFGHDQGINAGGAAQAIGSGLWYGGDGPQLPVGFNRQLTNIG